MINGRPLRVECDLQCDSSSSFSCHWPGSGVGAGGGSNRGRTPLPYLDCTNRGQSEAEPLLRALQGHQLSQHVWGLGTRC